MAAKNSEREKRIRWKEAKEQERAIKRSERERRSVHTQTSLRLRYVSASLPASC